MIATTKTQLTRLYLKRLEREKQLALATIAILTMAGFLGLLLHIAQDTYPDLISNILYPLTSGIGASWAFTTAFRATRGPLQLPKQYIYAWLLIGSGLLANCFGGLYYTILERTGQTILTPSFSDVGFTLFYPLIFVGLLFMPTMLSFRLRMALDALIATLGILGVSWFFAISKVFGAHVAAKAPFNELIMAISYPFWDMLLILAIVLLIYRRANPLFLASLILFGIGILANIWADTSYAYTAALGTYSTFNFLIDPFWYLGFLLTGLSGLYQYAALARRAYTEELPMPRVSGSLASTRRTSGSRWRFMQNALIYLPLAVLLILMLYSELLELISNQRSSLFFSGLTALVGILVAIRSLVATRDNESLLLALRFAKNEQESIAVRQAKLYKEVRLSHERLQELDKLKDQFMITASHELRTPLTSIQGYLELMVDYAGSLAPEQQHEFLLKAQRGSEELGLLLSNVMDASRLEIDAGIRPAHLQPVNLCETLQSVIDLIEPQVTHERRKVDRCIPPALTVQADPTRLRQVLLNVSINALKYSPPGTPISFSTRLVNEKAPAVVLSVIDQGYGIAPSDQDQLFQRFVRLERDLNSTMRGSGLGLYISRRLIEAMHGKIWVESTGIPGEGSRFHIQLPQPR